MPTLQSSVQIDVMLLYDWRPDTALFYLLTVGGGDFKDISAARQVLYDPRDRLADVL